MSTHGHLLPGDGRLRIARWRGDEHTAYLVPSRGPTSAEAVERALTALAAEGCDAAVTAALAPTEQAPFLAAGFAVHERLHLLERSVDDLPVVAADAELRRARKADRPQILAVDAAAFSAFWHLDTAGLDDALEATPSSRLRVATLPDDPAVIGYAITGRAGSRGYLQRLAVDPSAQGRGIGAALVVDGLRWLRRWGAREVLVNTQEANAAALSLYERLGFRRRTEGLAVLRRDLVPHHS